MMIIDAVDGFPLDKRNLDGQDYWKQTYGGQIKKFTDIVSKDKVSGFEKTARETIKNQKELDEKFEEFIAWQHKTYVGNK